MAHARLDAAIAALKRARAEDNRHKSPATAAAREKAMTEILLASNALTELIAKVYGFYGRRFEQVDAAEADAWRRRITGWARFNAVGAEAEPSA